MFTLRDRVLLLSVFVFLICTLAVAVNWVTTAQTNSDSAGKSETKSVENTAAVFTNGSDDRKKMTPVAPATAVPGETDPVQSKSVSAMSGRQVTVFGRALNEQDHGRPNAVVMLQEADGTVHSVTADKLGNFVFEKITDGQQIVLSTGDDQDLPLKLAGETKVFWRTRNAQTKNGKHSAPRSLPLFNTTVLHQRAG